MLILKLLDCQMPLFFDSSHSMALSDLQQPLPCHDDVWAAASCEEWRSLYLLHHGTAPVPNIHVMLRDLGSQRSVSPAIGDLARLILTYAVYITTWELRQQSRNELLSDISNQQSMHEWQSTARHGLEDLMPKTTGPQDPLGLRTSLTAHVHHVSLLLHCPLNDLLAFIGFQVGHQEKHDAQESLACGSKKTRAAQLAGPYIMLACSLLSSRSNPSRGFHEPFALPIAAVTIWAFNQLSSYMSSAIVRNHSGIELFPTVRLDKLRNMGAADSWIENGGMMRGHLTDVGNISAPGASRILLQVACRTLLTMETWTLSQGLQKCCPHSVILRAILPDILKEQSALFSPLRLRRGVSGRTLW
jgi:hypothetical protein